MGSLQAIQIDACGVEPAKPNDIVDAETVALGGDKAFLKALWAAYPETMPEYIRNPPKLDSRIASAIPDKSDPAKSQFAMPAKLWPEWYTPPPEIGDDRYVVSELIAKIAKSFGFTYAQVVGPRGNRDRSRARQTIFAILLKRGNASTQVARWMKRDHSTVLHGARQYNAFSERFPVYRVIFDHYTKQERERA